MTEDRRRVRAALTTHALGHQLDACRSDGKIAAMVIADDCGMALASSGDRYACDEVAARIVLVGQRIAEFNGTLFGGGMRWDVQMVKVDIEGSELLVCAVGGSAEQRRRQIKRGADGARRILATTSAA